MIGHDMRVGTPFPRHMASQTRAFVRKGNTVGDIDLLRVANGKLSMVIALTPHRLRGKPSQEPLCSGNMGKTLQRSVKLHGINNA